MKLSVYSIKQTMFEGEVERVTLPTPMGAITLLEHHLPLITLVEKGEVSYYTPGNQWQTIAFPGGVAEIRPGSEVVLLAGEEHE